MKLPEELLVEKRGKMRNKIVTIGKLFAAGLIKKSTKVRFVSIASLKKAGLIKTTKLQELILIAPKELITMEQLLKRGLIKNKKKR